MINWDLPGLIPALVSHWEAGLSHGKIAARLSSEFPQFAFSKNHIVGKTHRLKLPPRAVAVGGLAARAKAPTEKQDIAIRAILAAGRSDSFIAKLTNISRGRITRIRRELGYKANTNSRSAVKVTLDMPSPASTRDPVVICALIPRPAAPTPKPSQCLWLDGETPRTFTQCCENRLPGKSYCASHHKRAHIRCEQVAA